MEDISRQKLFCCIDNRTNVLICQDVAGENAPMGVEPQIAEIHLNLPGRKRQGI
jgi:hypothetical protein